MWQLAVVAVVVAVAVAAEVVDLCGSRLHKILSLNSDKPRKIKPQIRPFGHAPRPPSLSICNTITDRYLGFIPLNSNPERNRETFAIAARPATRKWNLNLWSRGVVQFAIVPQFDVEIIENRSVFSFKENKKRKSQDYTLIPEMVSLLSSIWGAQLDADLCVCLVTQVSGYALRMPTHPTHTHSHTHNNNNTQQQLIALKIYKNEIQRGIRILYTL